jgi:hypothetical protein
MTRTSLTLALVATLALAGCGKEDHTIVAGGPEPDDTANAAANGPVALPPSIVSSKIYRCADNQIVYVDWMSDGKSAHLRTDKAGTPTPVAAAEAGKPMTGAAGYSLEGSTGSASAKIGVPGHPAQTCKA